MLAICVCTFALTAAPQESLKLEIPNYVPRFALVKASQDGKSVAVDENGSTTPRQQTYTVQVPVTEQRTDKDGKKFTVTVMRTETRTRMLRVKMRAETYTVEIPMTRTITVDGKTKVVTENVKQTRTRMVPISSKPQLHQMGDCVFTDVSGRAVTDDVVLARLKKKTPVIIMNKGQKLSPFYKVALNPELLLLVLPAKVAPKPAAPGPAK